MRPPPTTRRVPPSTHSASQIIRDAENLRARRAVGMGAVICTIGAVALQMAPNRTALHWLATATVALAAVACVAIVVVFRRRLVPQPILLAVGVIMSLATLAAVAYLGIGSATCTVMCVLVFAYGIGDWALKGLVVYATLAGGYFILAALTVAGVIPMRDLAAGGVNFNAQLFATLALALEAILALTFWLARRIRQATRRAVEEAERVGRELSRRDAQLAEAQAQLDVAEGAGQRGRLSGQRIGPLDVGEILGRGGGGEVYRAWHDTLRVEVALKVLHQALQDDSHSLERFFREARACSALDSPHIVRVIETGRMTDGSPYLAMELLEGCDLSTYLREQDQISLSETAEIVAHVAAALKTAHSAGIVHRDIKPRNVFRSDRDGHVRWRVLDFGISKSTHDDTEPLTTAGAVIGTPGFMAPEQALGRAVDHRADLFSLGVIAYRCLTGRPAFVGDDPFSVMRAVVLSRPVSPLVVVSLPRDVELVLAIALEKERQHRFSSAAGLAEAFAAAAEGALADEVRARGERSLARQPWSEPEAASRRAPWSRLPGSAAPMPRSHTTVAAAD